MPVSTTRPWFAGPYTGVGLSLPTVWQGWAVLVGGVLAALLGVMVLHGPAREIAPLVALVATRVIIHFKQGA
jgi:hypothetical protein